MKNISFIITLFFIVSLSSFEKISAQPYTIKRLGMEDGLSSNYTQKIIQDQKGYIWVATSSGLNRFDGQKFILYGQDNHKTEQNWINSLLADPTNDNVWVGTDQGLFYFDYPTGSMMPHATPLSHLDKNITGLTAATDSGIWITHYTAGVIHWSAQDTTCYTPQTVLGLKGPFQTAVDDGNGNLYIGHSDKGLSIISIKNNFCKNYRHIPGNQNSLPDNSVNVIYKDKSHNIWLGTNNGLVLFNPQKESFTTFRQMEDNEHSLLGNQVADIKQMNDGTLWISTYLGGVSIFNLLENTFTPPAQAIFTRITASNDGHGLSSPNAQSIIQDSFGNIWIGNYRGGIDFISHTQPLFNTITYKTEKYGHNCNKQVWGLWADNNRQIWLGGEGELGIYKEGKEIEIIPLNQCRLNKQTHISVIHQDKHGDLWLGTHKHGVAIYHPDTKRITCIGDDKDGSLDILCFYEDTDGKIWIGTQSGLYSAYKGRFLKETLDSIAVQAHKDEFVLYIGDDASPERLDKIVESYQNKVNLVYHRFSENMGGKDLVAHWERCIQLSAEPFIWLFSDDDLMPADGVERVMEALSRPHHQRGYFFRFPLAVIDGENKRIRANRPLEEGSVSCYRLLLDKLQGKIDSAAVEYVFSREIWQSAGGFVHFPMAWCSDDATWAAFARHAGGVISLPGQPVCWRNVEGANISNSAGHDKDKLHATILFLRWMRNMFSDYVDDPELINALQCYIHTILRISLHKHYNICGLWGVSMALGRFNKRAAFTTFFRNFRLFS